MFAATRIKTGVDPLDKILGGGFLVEAVNLVYGEANTGKTTLILTTACNHLSLYRASHAYLIDSDNKLNTRRLVQIAEPKGKEVLKRMHIYTPLSFNEQEETLENLPSLEPLDLVIVDSITGLYRGETGDEETTYRINKELNRQLGYITEIAKRKCVAMILTGQVRSILDTNQIEPVAPRLLSYWSTTILKLEKAASPCLRQATIEKPIIPHNITIMAVNETGVTEATR